MEMKQADLNGLYLVLDPSLKQSVVLEKVKLALDGGAGMLQVWDNWPDGIGPPEKERWISKLLEIASTHDVPVLVNEHWELLKKTDLHGVHFDKVPDDIEKIRANIGRPFLSGITCGNDLDIVDWAEKNRMDYLSFCAMFPSPSVGSCEIVRPDTVRRAREITGIPLFLSGGITPGSIDLLGKLEFDGVAVISGILNAKDPREMGRAYRRALKKKLGNS